MKFLLSLALVTPLLLSCASVQSGPPATCPRLPVMDQVPPDVLEPSFIVRMQSLLSGSPTEQSK